MRGRPRDYPQLALRRGTPGKNNPPSGSGCSTAVAAHGWVNYLEGLTKHNMGSKDNKLNFKLGVNSPKKVPRLSLASRGPLSKGTPIHPVGQQNPSLEDCKPILGDRLGCGWGWASRRSLGEALPPLDISNETPPHSNTSVKSTQHTWNNVMDTELSTKCTENGAKYTVNSAVEH